MKTVHIYNELIDVHGISHIHKPFEIWFIRSHRASKCYNATLASYRRLESLLDKEWCHYHMWTRHNGDQIWGKVYSK